MLRSTTRSPSVFVDHVMLLWESHKTRLPLKKRRVVSAHDADWVGLATHSGSEEGV